MTREERNNYNYWLTRREVNNKIEKRCSICQEWKEEDSENFYYKNKNKKELGFVPACRNCTKTKANNYRADHAEENIRRCHDYYHTNKEEDNEKHQKIARDREKNREHQRNYHKGWLKRPENKPKIKMYGSNHRHHDISEEEWRNCLKSFGYKCAYCGISEEEHIRLHKQKLHREHVDDDGYNDLRNGIPSCRRCNSYKHQYEMEEWFREQEFFNEERLNKINWWITEGYEKYIEDKPPYRLLREKNEHNNKFHWNLWSVDEKRNLIDIIAIKDKKKELNIDIEQYLKLISNR